MPHLIHLDPSDWPFDEDFFAYVDRIKSREQSWRGNQGTASVALLFFEPSTRTYLSFQRAVSLGGAWGFGFHHPAGTSLEKGESIEDTVLNVLAMLPDAVVIRAGDEAPFAHWKEAMSVPIICAGWGKQSHPTQALLDSYTLFQVLGTLKGRRILYVGDGLHSRVFASHRQWFRRLGAELGYLMPKVWLPQTLHSDELVFQDKSEALAWAEVVIGLRFQKERWVYQEKRLRESREQLDHQSQKGERYSVGKNDLLAVRHQPWLMHPGPVGWGMEFDSSLRDYSKNLILKQVENGVWVRKAVLNWCMQGDG